MLEFRKAALLSLSGLLTLEPSHLEERSPLSRVPVMSELQQNLHIAWSLMGITSWVGQAPGWSGHSLPSFSPSWSPSLLRSRLSLLSVAFAEPFPKGPCLSCLLLLSSPPFFLPQMFIHAYPVHMLLNKPGGPCKGGN